MKADVRRVADKFYHVITFSSARTKARGMAIVDKHSLNIKVLDIWADSWGGELLPKLNILPGKLP